MTSPAGPSLLSGYTEAAVHGHARASAHDDAVQQGDVWLGVDSNQVIQCVLQEEKPAGRGATASVGGPNA